MTLVDSHKSSYETVLACVFKAHKNRQKSKLPK